jgi:hypothetical protein
VRPGAAGLPRTAWRHWRHWRHDPLRGRVETLSSPGSHRQRRPEKARAILGVEASVGDSTRPAAPNRLAPLAARSSPRPCGNTVLSGLAPPAAPRESESDSLRRLLGRLLGAGGQLSAKRDSLMRGRRVLRNSRGVTLGVSACSSAEERRPSKPRVGGSNPSRRARGGRGSSRDSQGTGSLPTHHPPPSHGAGNGSENERAKVCRLRIAFPRGRERPMDTSAFRVQAVQRRDFSGSTRAGDCEMTLFGHGSTCTALPPIPLICRLHPVVAPKFPRACLGQSERLPRGIYAGRWHFRLVQSHDSSGDSGTVLARSGRGGCSPFRRDRAC